MKWQPIKTVPKDGSSVLLRYEDDRGCVVIRHCFWDGTDSSWPWVCVASFGDCADDSATHWVPVPE